MKILVTGCMGFIGSNIVPKLLNKGFEVVGFDNLVNPSIDPTDRMKSEAKGNWGKFKFYNVDIRHLDQMMTIAVNEKPDMVIHLAALGSVPRSFEQPSLVIDVNERGFSNMLSLAAFLNVKRIVFASSSSVYGNSDKTYRVEGEEGFPLSPYAMTKMQNETLAKIWCNGLSLNYIGLRFFNVYGPGQVVNSPYASVIPRFCALNKLMINGDGSITRDFTYVDDVCNAIMLSLQTKHQNFVCNVGTGVGTTINELAEMISKGEKEIEYYKPRLGDVIGSIAHIERAKSYIGFRAFTNLKTGIEKTQEYYNSLQRPHEDQLRA